MRPTLYSILTNPLEHDSFPYLDLKSTGKMNKLHKGSCTLALYYPHTSWHITSISQLSEKLVTNSPKFMCVLVENVLSTALCQFWQLVCTLTVLFHRIKQNFHERVLVNKQQPVFQTFISKFITKSFYIMSPWYVKDSFGIPKPSYDEYFPT